MALKIPTAEKLARKKNKPNCAETAAYIPTIMAIGDTKKFFNTGNEFLHIEAPAGNVAAVTVTISSKAALDSGRLGDKVFVLAAGSIAVITNLNPLDFGNIVTISTNLSGTDKLDAVIITPNTL